MAKSKLHRNQRSSLHPDASRRAVVLLVVLSLLVLFVIVGLTFTLVSSVYRKTATESANNADREDDWSDEPDRALYMMLRDSERVTFALHNSLLEDIYGDRPLITQVTAVNAAAYQGGELLTLECGIGFNVNADVFSGGLVTLTSGPARNRTYRIVNSAAAGPGTPLRLLLSPTSRRGDFVREWSGNAFATDSYVPVVGDRIVINRRPFSGMGLGVSPPIAATGRPALMDQVGPVDATPPHRFMTVMAESAASSGSALPLTGVPPYLALMPNLSGYDPGAHMATLGGLNEDWDAADFQNAFLSWVQDNASHPTEIIPSFHRPALVRYWFQWCRANIFEPNVSVDAMFSDPNYQWQYFNNPPGPGAGWGPMIPATGTPSTQLPIGLVLRELRRRIIFRPLPEDHPGFASADSLPAATAGANPGFTLAGFGGAPGSFANRWDVDNTGDGVPESIWLDPLFPVKRTKDGRLYKTLIAPHIIDLDGRVNLNASDTNLLAQIQLYGNYPVLVAPSPPAPNVQRRGQGLGPAEIDLRGIFGAGALRDQLLSGRHQPSGVAGGVGDDLLSYIDHRGLPRVFTHPGASYHSVPDLNGLRRTGVDKGGHPVVDAYADYTNYREGVNDTYEIRMLNPTDDDTIYDAADMEGMLRSVDYDQSTLSNRLSGIPSDRRNAVTTLSNDVPAPASPSSPMLLAQEQVNPTGLPPTIMDVFRSKLINGGAPAASIDLNIDAMVAPEMRRGEPFDLNRPFGNGRDDHQNPEAGGSYVLGTWVADDILEWANGLGLTFPAPDGNVADWGTISGNPNYAASTLDLVNDDPVSMANMAAMRRPNTPQQIYARHLYCLTMLLVDGYQVPFSTIANRSPSGGNNTSFNNGGVPAAQEAERTAERIAQWAVNVADFRDPDSSMTVFEYDLNPWNGWTVDGLASTDEGGDRRVVIGLEAPELLLTEAFSTHDVRIRDTALDETGKDRNDAVMPDDDDDQFAFPIASLFLELFCPRTPSPVVNSATSPPPVPVASQPRSEQPSAELYEKTNAGWALDVGRVCPPRAVAGGGASVSFPVWRVAISEHHVTASPDSENRKLRDNYFDDQRTLNLTRFVWFTPGLDPKAVVSGNPVYPASIRNNTFANLRGANVLHNAASGAYSFNVLPGQYMVVLPRANTAMGSVTVDATATPPESPSPQQFGLDATSGLPLFFSTNVSGVNTGPIGVAVSSGTPGRLNTSPALALVAERRRDNWTNTASLYSGINVSEEMPDAAGLEQVSEPNPTNDATVSPPDAYMDVHNNISSSVISPGVSTDEPFYKSGLLANNGLDDLQTHANVRTAYLQRLACPLIPWNPFPGDPLHDATLPVNPYVSVDWSPIDLTVFSGEMNKSAASDPVADNYHLGGRQRGVTAAQAYMITPWYPRADWTPQSFDDPVAAGAVRPPFYRMNFQHTLGFLNSWEIPVDGSANLDAGGSAQRQPAGPGNYVGYPVDTGTGEQIFPWIKFNNRPYSSAMEIVQVPTVGPFRLGVEFSIRSGPGYTQASDADNFLRPFSHLLNFHWGSDRVAWPAGGPPAPGALSMDVFRLLDFVHTPSQFVDSKRWVVGPGGYPTRLKPPYNRLLEFREPGKLNLNTMSSPHAWNALMYRFPDWAGRYAQLAQSRQGYMGLFADVTSAPILPTRFANPFRSAMAAAHMPDIPYRDAPDTHLHNLQKREIEATLFRSELPTAAAPNPDPIFRVPDAALTDRRFDRHAGLYHEGLQRLDNLTTHRSNCYAIWITSGYFEVEPNNIGGSVVTDSGHRDGYRILRELGTDTGEIKRQRAFYIIDRSIPVGFERGKNHNVDDAVLLRRVIE